MSTQADVALEELTRSGRISHTGHAPEPATDEIFLNALAGERLVIVESDEAGYPKITEKWDATRYSDGSLLIATYVRGREDTAYWKAIPNLKGFEVWHQDETLEAIVQMANEEAVYSMKAVRDERRRARRDRAWAEAELASALTAWEAAGDSSAPKPTLDDFYSEDDFMKLAVTERQRSWVRSEFGRHDVPDGWDLWYRLWKELLDWHEPNIIFTGAGRRDIKDELHGRLESEHDAVQFISELGIDDFYGVRKYPSQCHVWHAAIQAWVKAVRPAYFSEDQRAA